jgi:hypothetical protein
MTHNHGTLHRVRVTAPTIAAYCLQVPVPIDSSTHVDALCPPAVLHLTCLSPSLPPTLPALTLPS